MNEPGNEKTIAKINKSESWFLEKGNKTDKPSTRLLKEKKERGLSKIRNEKEDISTDTTDIQRLTETAINSCNPIKKNGNLERMDTFLERCMLSRLNQEELENINRPITSSEIENVIKNIPTNKS